MIEFIAGPYGLWLLLGLLLIAVAILPAVLIRGRRRQNIASRLVTGTTMGTSASVTAPAKPQKSLFEALGRRLSDEDKDAVSGLRLRMVRAGYLSRSAPYIFTGLRLVSMLAVPLTLMAVHPLLPVTLEGQTLILTLTGATLCGFILPTTLLDRKINKREQQYRDGFPDMMDLFVACVEAGLSIDAAILRISDELGHRYPYLADQLHLMALEMRAGRDRNVAWKNLAERLGLEEARSLATMLKQSEDLGTSIGETLRVFASDMRERRMLLAEEKALALPAKLVLPLIVFVFPTLLSVLILPAVVRMMWVMEQTA